MRWSISPFVLSQHNTVGTVSVCVEGVEKNIDGGYVYEMWSRTGDVEVK